MTVSESVSDARVAGTPDVPAAAAPSAGKALARGLLWTSIGRTVAQLLSWAATLVVARLLSPADYGIAGIATVWWIVAWALADLGISYLVSSGALLDQKTLRSLHTIALGGGVVVATILVFSSGPISQWYGSPMLRGPLLLVALSIVVESSRLVPAAQLQRLLGYRQGAIVELAKALTQSAAVLTCALSGLGYWSLMVAHLLATCVAAVTTLRFLPMRPAIRSFRWPAEQLRRARVLQGGALAWFVYRNGDVLIVGRLGAADSTGFFNMARTIAWLPIERLVSVLTSLTQALFAHLRDDLTELRTYMLWITEAVVLVTLLPLVGLVVTADIAVPPIIGAKWLPSVTLLRVLCFPAFVSGVFAISSQVAMVRGGERNILLANVSSIGLMFFSYAVVGSVYGVAWGAAVWGMLTLGVFIWLTLRTLHSIDLSVREYLRAWRAGVIASALLAVAVLTFRAVAGPELGPRPLFAWSVVVGVLVGGAGLWWSGSPVVMLAANRVGRRLRARFPESRKAG